MKAIKTMLKHNISEEALKSIAEVLEFGDMKHPGETWRLHTPHFHITRANTHSLAWDFITKLDSETGLNNLAHAAARILMALTLALEEEKK